jgi:hypothetical protein
MFDGKKKKGGWLTLWRKKPAIFLKLFQNEEQLNGLTICIFGQDSAFSFAFTLIYKLNFREKAC